MGKVFLLGQKGEAIEGNGFMESSMDMAGIKEVALMKNMVNGKMEEELGGWMVRRNRNNLMKTLTQIRESIHE